MRVLVTGASGFVGRHLLARLHEAGNTAIVLRRGGEARDGIFVGPADLADSETWPDWPRDIDAVIHLAALNPSRGARVDQATLDHANADATEALAKRCAAENVRRIVFVSTALVHSSDAAKAIDESALPAPQNPYARSKLKAEQALWKALQGSSTEGCVVRPVPVFGVGGRGMIGALMKLARLPIPLPLGKFGGPRSIVSIDNLVDALLLCAQSPKAAGQTFLVADEKPLTVADIVATFRRALGRSPRILPSAQTVLGLLAGAAGKGHIWRSISAPFVVSTEKIRRDLSWTPRVPTDVSLAQLARHDTGAGNNRT